MWVSGLDAAQEQMWLEPEGKARRIRGAKSVGALLITAAKTPNGPLSPALSPSEGEREVNPFRVDEHNGTLTQGSDAKRRSVATLG